MREDQQFQFLVFLFKIAEIYTNSKCEHLADDQVR